MERCRAGSSEGLARVGKIAGRGIESQAHGGNPEYGHKTAVGQVSDTKEKREDEGGGCNEKRGGGGGEKRGEE